MRFISSSYLAPCLVIILSTLLLSGCSTNPPKDIDNACSIFREKDDWYKYAWRASAEFNVPVSVLLSIMHQESKFKQEARPERQWILGFIPWFRPSSAYGYAQVKDETWDWYREKTSRFSDDRNDFADAIFFMAWYIDLSAKNLGISRNDVYNNYLAYHEGHGGYKRKTYNKKKWLLGVSEKVRKREKFYRSQLSACADELNSGSWWWPF